MLAILNETKSVDTFLMTLGLLADAKADHRAILPTVIRNAERLGIFARHVLQGESSPDAEAFAAVSKAIEKLVPHAQHAVAPMSAPKRGRVVPAGPTVPDGSQTKFYLPQENATPVLPPIPQGQRPVCDNAPDHAAILRTMSRAERGVPGVYDVCREDFEFITEKLVDKIDPPRFFPLIGPAQLQHCHWKCTIYYNETLEFASPVGFSFTRPQVEVVYMDRDRLYLWADAAASKRASDEANTQMERFLAHSEDMRPLLAEWERFWDWYQQSHQELVQE
jgi:hypothetical protein